MAKKENKKALVVFSGGQDSTTCLYYAKDKYDEVIAVGFNYGQKHVRETEAAGKIAGIAGVSYELLNIPNVLGGMSPLTNPRESLETYKDAVEMEEVIGDRVELTFVPMRNALFLTIAANYALVNDCDVIVTGVCEEDNANYPDCRRVFIDSMEAMIREALGGTYLEIDTPLMNLSKAETVEMALGLEGCYEALAYSHTAYSGEYPPITQDHATVLRADGFERAGIPDPLILRAYHENLLHALPDTENYKGFENTVSVANALRVLKGSNVVLSEQEIDEGVEELAKDLSVSLKDHPVAIIAVMDGSILFAADLLKKLHKYGINPSFFTVSAKSYGLGKLSNGSPTISYDFDITALAGRKVVVVDDIWDTGRTLLKVLSDLKRDLGYEACSSISFDTAVLISKAVEGEGPEPTYYVFDATEEEKDFFVGYGLDDEHEYRGQPYITAT